MPVDLYFLLMKLRHGGSLVSSVSCSAEELAMARGEDRAFFDKDGHGYVYRPPLPRLNTPILDWE